MRHAFRINFMTQQIIACLNNVFAGAGTDALPFTVDTLAVIQTIYLYPPAFFFG